MQTWQIFAAVVVAVAIVLIAVLLAIRARRNRQQRRQPTVEPPRDQPTAADQANPPRHDGQVSPGPEPSALRGEADRSLFDDVPTSLVRTHQVDAAAGPDRDDRTDRLPVHSADRPGGRSDSPAADPAAADPAAADFAAIDSPAVHTPAVDPTAVESTAPTHALSAVDGRSNGRPNVEEPARSDEPHRHARSDDDDLLVPMSVPPVQGPGGRHRAPTGSAHSTEARSTELQSTEMQPTVPQHIVPQPTVLQPAEPAGGADPAPPLVPGQRGRSLQPTEPAGLADDQLTEPRGGRIVPDGHHSEPVDIGPVAQPGDRDPVVPHQNVGRDTAADVTTAIPKSDPTADPDGATPDDQADPDESRGGRSLADRLLGRRR